MITETDDINALVDHWTCLFSIIIDKHAPIVEKRVSDKFCPWMNKELKDLIRTRDKLKKSAVESKSALIMESYRQVRNRVNSLNKRLKKKYYTNKISSCKGNIKDSILKGSDSKTVRNKDIPEEMNSYFSSIGKELADKIRTVSNPLLSGSFVIYKSNAKFQFRDVLAKVRTAKGFGIGNISSFFLKLALPFVENSLALLFNTSIETSTLPKSWKKARVTPIFKGGDRTDKSNYRPISVLPVIARLFEKLVANQLYQHVVDNRPLSLAESAYRRLHSTVTHLLKNTNDCYSGLNTGKVVGLTFIDLKIAFDTVDHVILCRKLEHYGIQQRGLACMTEDSSVGSMGLILK